MDEHLEFISSSVLAVIMTYANLRLSAEMSLFIRKKERHLHPRLKVAKEKTLTLACPIICVGLFSRCYHGTRLARKLEEVV